MSDEVVAGQLDRFWTGAASRKRFTIINLAFGYINVAISIVVGVVMVPSYLRHLGPQTYGYWLASGGVVFWLGMLDFGIAGLVGQRVGAAFAKRNASDIIEYYTAALFIQLGLFSLVTLLSAVIAWYTPRLLGVTGSHRALSYSIFFAGLTAGFQFICNSLGNTLNGLQRPVVKFVAQTVCATVTIGLTVVMLQRGFGIYSLAVGLLAGYACNCAILLFYTMRLLKQAGVRFHLSPPRVRELVGLGAHAFSSSAVSVIGARLEPTIVAFFLGPELAVVYALTRRGVDVLGIAVSQVIGSSVAGITNMYSSMDTRATERVVRDVALIACLIAAVCMITYATVSCTVTSVWVGSKFYAGRWAVFSMIGAFAVASLLSVTTQFLAAVGDFPWVYRLTTFEGTARLLILVVCVWWVRSLWSVPLATILTGTCSAALGIRRLRSHTAIGIRFGDGIYLLLIGAVVAVFGTILSPAYLPGEKWLGVGALAMVTGVISTLVLGGTNGRVVALLRNHFGRAPNRK